MAQPVPLEPARRAEDESGLQELERQGARKGRASPNNERASARMNSARRGLVGLARADSWFPRVRVLRVGRPSTYK